MGKKRRHKPVQPADKVPQRAQVPEQQRVPRAVGGTSYYCLRPSWRVGRMEMVEPFGWHRVDGSTIQYIRSRLAHFETMTWAEILVQAKKQNHSIHVEDICSAAQQRLEAIGLLLEDVVSLRLSGRERVYGYLENGVLIVLWWDPLHQICPSLKE